MNGAANLFPNVHIYLFFLITVLKIVFVANTLYENRSRSRKSPGPSGHKA